MIATSVLAAGCISTSVGEVSYSKGNVSISIISPAQVDDSYIQVTAYRVKDLHQEETAVFGAPVTLVAGENSVLIPGQITPGQYKLFIYVIQDGQRKTAVIRDIRV